MPQVIQFNGQLLFNMLDNSAASSEIWIVLCYTIKSLSEVEALKFSPHVSAALLIHLNQVNKFLDSLCALRTKRQQKCGLACYTHGLVLKPVP